MMRTEVYFEGIPVWLPDRQELLSAIDAQLAAPSGAVRPARLFTLNPEIVMLAARDPSYHRVLESGEWNIVDGAGLATAIRFRSPRSLGLGKRDFRHPGADRIHDLADAAARADRSMLIIGGTAIRLEKACQHLRSANPRLEVEGISPEHTPSFPLREQAAIEEALARLRPGVVVVCLGAPKQERWIDSAMSSLAAADVRIAAGLGGTVDFLSGEVPRAPATMRRMHLEWVYRLVQEPWRWRRQSSTLPSFAVRALFSPALVARTKPVVEGRRVVLYAHFMPPYPSASATRITSLARSLRADGHRVTLLTSAPGPQVPEFHIERPRGRLGLVWWLLTHRACPILVSSPPATPASEVAAVARLLGYRVVVDIRDPFVSEALGTGDLKRGHRTWIKSRLERLLLGVGHTTTLVSRPLLTRMQQLTGDRIRNALIAPNGVDTSVFSRDAAGRAEIRSKHGFGDAPVFVYSGILGGKELDKVLAALAPALRVGAFALIIAVVDEYSIPVMRMLKEVTQACGVSDRVVWVENASADQVSRHLSAADIGINPLPLRRSYCLPVKTFEYLACGLYNLVHANRGGALVDLLSDPVTGAASDSWDEFAAAAVKLSSEIDRVRAGVTRRIELARDFDRDGANAVLKSALFADMHRS